MTLTTTALGVSPAPTAAALYEGADRVIGQRDAKEAIAVLLERQTRVARGELPRSSGALCAGRTGTGKTMTIRIMAEKCGLPFAECNATQYTDKGYVGPDLSQIFLPLIEAAIMMEEEDLEAKYGKEIYNLIQSDDPTNILKIDRRILDPAIEKAQSGVVLLDEFDKWMQQASDALGRNPGKALQGELLKMIEGGHTYVTDDEDEIGLAFDTTKVLIICAGAFVGLEKIIGKRLQRDMTTQPEAWDQSEPADFVRYGLLPELAGRLPHHIMFKPLRPDHLAVILMEEGGLLDEYVGRFQACGVKLVYSEEGLRTLADKALQRGTGARGLEHVFSRKFSKALYQASKKGSGKVVLDVPRAMSEDPVLLQP